MIAVIDNRFRERLVNSTGKAIDIKTNLILNLEGRQFSSIFTSVRARGRLY